MSSTSVFESANGVAIIAGAHNNENVCTRINSSGETKKKLVGTDSGGVDSDDYVRTTVEEIDNSSDFPCGKINIFASNQLTLEAAAGGIVMNSSGNIGLDAGGGLLSLDSNVMISMKTENIQMSVISDYSILAKAMEIEVSDSLEIIGNTSFHNNVTVKGGLYVNGELFVKHMTCQTQLNFTDDCEIMYADFNESANVYLTVPENFQSFLFLSIPFPDPIGRVITVPCTLQTSVPHGPFRLSSSNPSSGGFDPTAKGPVMIPAHSHSYNGPSYDGVKTTSDFWKKAAKCTNSSSAIPAEPTKPNGMTPQELVKAIGDKQVERVKNWAKERGKNFLNRFLP